LSTKVKNIQACHGCKRKFLVPGNKIWFSNYYFVIAQYGYADLIEKKLKEEELKNKETLQLELQLSSGE
jgi:hypothetical protein